MASPVLKKYQAIWFKEGYEAGLAKNRKMRIGQETEQETEQSAKQKSILIATAMLRRQMDIDAISGCTGVSKKALETLKALQSEGLI